MENSVKKFNFIDWTILGLFFAAAIFFGIKVVGGAKPIGQITGVNIVLKKQPQAVVDSLRAGDKLYSLRFKSGTKSYGSIESILLVSPEKVVNNDVNGRLVVENHPFENQIQLHVVFNQPVLVYPSKMVYSNSSFALKLQVGQEFELNNSRVNQIGEIISQDYQPFAKP